MGAALNTKVTAPSANHATASQWTLNNTNVTLDYAVVLTDHAARLTYSVDNGCTTGIGSGGLDETSTVLTVWKEPEITSPASTLEIIVCKNAPVVLPVVAYDANNCTVTVEWSYGSGKTALTAASKGADGMNGQAIYCRLKWTAPDGTTKGETPWKQLGKFTITTKPTVTALTAPAPGTAEVWYARGVPGTCGAKITNDGGLTCTTKYTLDGTQVSPTAYTLKVEDNNKKYRYIAANSCGETSAELTLNFPVDFVGDDRFRIGNGYFGGLRGHRLVGINTNVDFNWDVVCYEGSIAAFIEVTDWTAYDVSTISYYNGALPGYTNITMCANTWVHMGNACEMQKLIDRSFAEHGDDPKDPHLIIETDWRNPLGTHYHDFWYIGPDCKEVVVHVYKTGVAKERKMRDVTGKDSFMPVNKP